MNNIKKIIAIVLSLVMVFGTFSTAFAETSKGLDFEGHWAQTTIQKWIDESKISGYPDGSFKPDANITRAEFVKLVNGLIDFDTKGNIAFNDVKTGDWYYDVISIANEIGYISGYSDKQFGPNDNITREQAAAILSRIQYLGENANAAKEFSDNSKISVWALGSVGAASEAGFVKGYNDESFKPLNNLTRAEAVTMLDNVLVNAKNKVITKAGTELNDTVVEGDLIIAKTVGEGDVHLNNVEVKGSLYVYGGGNNSLYFNNVKVAKIIVEKNKVRLVLDDGTTVGEILANSEAKLENIGGTVAKVTINSDGKVALSGSFDEVVVESSADIVLNDAKIENLVVEKAINILGTGTIATLTANADGIQFDSTTKITKTVVGEGVTEKPVLIPSGGTGGPSGGDETATYKLVIGVSYKPTTSTDIKATFTPENTYSSTAIISDYLVSEVSSILSDSAYTSTINDYLTKINSRLSDSSTDGFVIGDTIAYSAEGWDKAISYLVGTSITQTELDSLKNKLMDKNIEISDLKDILSLYDSSLVLTDLNAIKNNLNGYPFDTQTVTYNGKEAVFKINTDTKSNEEMANFILDNIAYSTKTVDQFFEAFGVTQTDGKSITIEISYDGKVSTITLLRVAQ